MKRTSLILVCLIFLTVYVTEASTNRCISQIDSAHIISDLQNDTHSEIDKVIEKAAKEVICELLENKPNGTTTFYYKVRNGVEALTFVQQSLLNHTDNLVLIDSETETYLYESPFLKVVYTENGKIAHSIAEVTIYLKTPKAQYIIIFTP